MPSQLVFPSANADAEQTPLRPATLRQEVPAQHGVALHHVSAKDGKDGMMSRPVWEDGTSWAGNELCGEVG